MIGRSFQIHVPDFQQPPFAPHLADHTGDPPADLALACERGWQCEGTKLVAIHSLEPDPPALDSRDKELVLLSFLVAIISRRLPLSEFHQAARERLRLRQIAGCRRGLLRPLAAFRRADITVFGNPL